VVSDRKMRKFVRTWRRRYPHPVPWVDDRANKQCRISEDRWLLPFAGASSLRRRDLLGLVLWKFGAQEQRMARACQGVTGPADLGHAKRSIRKALSSDSPTAALDHLCGETGGISNWDAVMASVVLGVCRPERYVVADERCLRTLAALQLHEPIDQNAFTRHDWVPYLRLCRRLGNVSGLSMRDVARALWAAADDAPDLPKDPKGRRR
jgi:hypothetical protein